MTTLEKVFSLLKTTNKGDYVIEREIGLKRGCIANWRLDRGKPSADALTKIADYFNVSVDYLLGRTDIRDTNIHPSNEYFPDGTIAMPVIGYISAGYDGNATEEIIDNIKILPINLRGHAPEECFLLRVRGDSMYPDFHDGDIVAVHRQTSVNSGSIAVVMYDGDYATLKKVEYEPGCNWVKLVPRNPEFKEKTIRGVDLNECRVLGLVISLVYRAIV